MHCTIQCTLYSFFLNIQVMYTVYALHRTVHCILIPVLLNVCSNFCILSFQVDKYPYEPVSCGDCVSPHVFRCPTCLTMSPQVSQCLQMSHEISRCCRNKGRFHCPKKSSLNCRAAFLWANQSKMEERKEEIQMLFWQEIWSTESRKY